MILALLIYNDDSYYELCTDGNDITSFFPWKDFPELAKLQKKLEALTNYTAVQPKRKDKVQKVLKYLKEFVAHLTSSVEPPYVSKGVEYSIDKTEVDKGSCGGSERKKSGEH